MANGAFLMSREIFENNIWNDVLKFRIFFYIVGNAIFAEEGVTVAGMDVKRGQYLRSLRNLQNDLTYREGKGGAIKKPPIETLRRKIKELENEGRITTKSTEYGTLFTVVNYAVYQEFEHYRNKQMGQEWDNNGTAMGQQRDNNNNVNNVNKDNISSRVYEKDSDEMILVDFFIQQIRINDEKFKDPNKQKWADEFRKIIELDKRDKREVARLIKWVQQDDFWKSNILSPTKLRKQYSNLLIKMNASKITTPQEPKSPSYVNGMSEKDLLNMGE